MKIVKKSMIISLFILFIFVLAHLILYGYAKLNSNVNIKNMNSLFLYDKDENLIFQGNDKREWISLKEISPHLINATLSIEDKLFYNHLGFDYLRILKSFYVNTISGKYVEGASTITQQYAKNLYLDFSKNWKRKIEEAWLTIDIETNYSKDEILEGYLNTINYGNGVLGIENASKYYFDKSAKDLTLAEATMIAGIPKSPNNYSPINDELEAKKRQLLILNSMIKNKYITEVEKEEVLNTNLIYVGNKEKYNLSTLMYYQDAVMKELKSLKHIPSSLVETGGLKIYTNLDINAQTILENAINNELKDNFDIQTSVIVSEPKTGKILALTGGRDYASSQFNRATNSKRQVGSSIKPFLYYLALENGFTASTTFQSEPTTFTFGNNKQYSPQNYAKNYPNKPVSMAAAISYSDNIYAVKTHLFLGEELLPEMMKRVGLKEKLNPDPSLPLGTGSLNIIDYLTAYTTLADEGNKKDLYLISKITDMDGKIIYEHKKNSETVLDKNITYILNDLLTTTYDFNMLDYNTPTCLNIADKIVNKWAIKTGTTDNDSWSIGYNKDLLVGVWVGYDNNQNLIKGDSKYSKNIWVNISETYLKDKKTEWYTMPENVVGVLTDPINGNIADENSNKKRILYYLKGSEPLKQ